MHEITFRLAEERDADQIPGQLCGNFPPAITQLMIYGCAGAADYVRMQISSGCHNPDSVYYVADLQGRVIAAAELRRSPGSLFLNYIGVDPEFQGEGAGRRLLAYAIKMSGACAYQISLDVFDHNGRALAWYGRLGFQVRETSEFLEIAPPLSVVGGTAFATDLPQANVCQERFGFSRFTLTTDKAVWSIGRIGKDWFRLTQPAALADPGVISALRLLDLHRRIFALIPSSAVRPEHITQVLTTTHRMQAETSHVLNCLQ